MFTYLFDLICLPVKQTSIWKLSTILKKESRQVPLTNGFANTISTPSSFTQASLLAQRRKIVGKGNTYFFRMDASTEMILGRQFFCRQQYKTMTGRKRKQVSGGLASLPLFQRPYKHYVNYYVRRYIYALLFEEKNLSIRGLTLITYVST